MMEKKNLERHRARLSGEVRHDEIFRGLDLRGAVAQQSTWTRCTFDTCRLSLAALGNATFDSCTFTSCDMRQAVMVSRIHKTRFIECDLDQANLTGAWITESEFIRCRGQLSNWDRATVGDSKLDIDLRGADFNPALTENVDFTGSNLWGTRIPMSCALTATNTFDERQIGCFLALLETAKLPPKLALKIRGIAPDRYRKLVQRVLRVQSEGV